MLRQDGGANDASDSRRDNVDPGLNDDLGGAEPDGPVEGDSDSTESSSSSSDASTDDEPVIHLELQCRGCL